ncbi:hypothetical protein ZWY2020_045421 [Hordeum vulgare]|nr:hypothetical protein ZWY2020_045421 [Hordeum vulgare]
MHLSVLNQIGLDGNFCRDNPNRSRLLRRRRRAVLQPPPTRRTSEPPPTPQSRHPPPTAPAPPPLGVVAAIAVPAIPRRDVARSPAASAPSRSPATGSPRRAMDKI